MINIDERLFDLVDHSEFWLLIHVAKRLNKDRVCWPSNKILMRDTKWSMEKLQKYKLSLVNKGLLKVSYRNNERGQASNHYTVTTKLIGIYIGVEELGWLSETPTGKTEGGDTGLFPTPPTGKTHNEVLTNEVLTNEHIYAGFVNSVYDHFDTLRQRCNFRGTLHRTKERERLVSNLFKKGYKNLDEFRSALNYVFHEWHNNDKMRAHLTPETIFRPSNFPKYVEGANNTPAKDWTENNSAATAIGGANDPW